MIERLQKSRWTIPLLGVLLIVLGLAAMVHYVRGMQSTYREMEFARANNFAAGPPDIELIRPWMNIRYIAVAFAVPQEYLYNELGIPMNPENSLTPLQRLGGRPWPGAKNRRPDLLEKVQAAILKYQKDPVATGLRERKVQGWMSVQYIANSTGIPAEVIFQQTGISPTGHAYIPLDGLSKEIQFSGGMPALIRAIQQVIDTYPKP